MKMDTNTNGHRQWFYFSVRNLMAGVVKFNIYRFKKKFSLFQRGMRPYILSVKSKKGWKPGGNKIFYRMQKNDYKKQNQTPTYYLTFQYKFQQAQDEVYFASGLPYTVSFLKKRLTEFTQTMNDQVLFQVSDIGKTLAGQNLKLVSIQPKRMIDRPNIIVINARTHAGETSSSWVLDGLMQKLMKDNILQNWINQNNIYLKIVPMLNPDGVFMGNYRTGVIGEDFNRKFATGKKQFFPQIYAIKKLVNDLKKLGRVFLFLDLHGHSILKNSFIYGPSQNLFMNHPLRNLSFNLWHSSKYFRLSSCKFKFNLEMAETARVHFQLKENILTYTCETSLGLYYQGNNTIQMMQDDYKSLGASIITSIAQMLNKQKIQSYKQSTPQQNSVNLQRITQSHLSNQFNKPIIKQYIKPKDIESKTAGSTKREKMKQRETCIQKIKNIKKQLNQQMSKQQLLFSKNVEKSQKLINKSLKKTIMQQSSTTKAANFNNQQSDMRRTFKFQLGNKRKSDSFAFELQSPSARQQEEENPVRAVRLEQNKNNREAQFKIRRKSDVLKILPQSIRKKLGHKLQIGFNNSKVNKTIQEQFRFERSATYDSSYLSTQIQAVRQNDAIQQNDLQVINQKFSEEYESINDSDNSSQDLEDKEKQYIIQCIKINKKIKTNAEEEQQNGQYEMQEVQYVNSNIPMTTNINGFKQIRFKSIQAASKIGVPFRSTKRQIHKFRDYTYKSLGRGLYQQQQPVMIPQMVQKKQLNQRLNKKNVRQPYFLIQIKNKNHQKSGIGRVK